MESIESQESGSKENRGRQPRMIGIHIQVPFVELGILTSLQLKRMKQLGEDVTRDRIISEAIQCLAKAQSSEAGA